jgi:hypothetical protein
MSGRNPFFAGLPVPDVFPRSVYEIFRPLLHSRFMRRIHQAEFAFGTGVKMDHPENNIMFPGA